jgi:hypothetical protein
MCAGQAKLGVTGKPAASGNGLTLQRQECRRSLPALSAVTHGASTFPLIRTETEAGILGSSRMKKGPRSAKRIVTTPMPMPYRVDDTSTPLITPPADPR